MFVTANYEQDAWEVEIFVIVNTEIFVCVTTAFLTDRDPFNLYEGEFGEKVNS